MVRHHICVAESKRKNGVRAIEIKNITSTSKSSKISNHIDTNNVSTCNRAGRPKGTTEKKERWKYTELQRCIKFLC